MGNTIIMTEEISYKKMIIKLVTETIIKVTPDTQSFSLDKDVFRPYFSLYLGPLFQ